MNFYIYNHNTSGKTPESQVITLPENNGSMKVMVDGACNDSSVFQLVVTWMDETNYTVILDFLNYKNKNWTLRKISFEFGDSDLRYETENEHWFNRTFHPNEYFYCDTCKEFSFTNESGACVNDGKDCSYVTMDNSRIYLGDYDGDNPKKKLCLEDWIAQREIIVPIAVGAFLSFLLIILLLAYVAAFIKRKVTEKSGVRYKKVDR